MSNSNSSRLRSLSNQISKNLNSLKELGVPTDHWDVLIIFLMCIIRASLGGVKQNECATYFERFQKILNGKG